ncbi:MAG: S8 family peptidase [bacterium]|nr:S8 family peptidase [bacterium]
MNCEDKIYSNEYIEIITEFELTKESSLIFGPDYCYQPISECFGFATVHNYVQNYYNFSRYGYSYIPKVYSILQEDLAFDTFNLSQSGIYNLQQPPSNLTGQGVVIGFIDTGIDYTNPVFQTNEGSTRILGIWDQTLPGGTHPEGISYGTEFKEAEINDALKSDNPLSMVPTKDENGHGTAIASVACGSRLDGGTQFLGAAPDSRIAVVKLKPAKKYLRDYYLVPDDAVCFQESDILAGLRYLNSFAISLSRPLVICLALGTNLGGHTGDSKLADMLTRIAEKKSRAVVVGGGNEGLAAHHYKGSLSSVKPEDLVEINVSAPNEGFVVEFWGQNPYLFTVTVRSPRGEVSPPASLRSEERQIFDLVLEKSKIEFDALTIEQNTGRLLIVIRIVNPSAGVWQVSVKNTSNTVGGEFDMFLPITEFLSHDVTFLSPSPASTITNPGYSSPSMTVVAYDATTKSVSPTAGKGYNLNGGIKPDLVVPGINIPTILGRRSGSSFAAAIAAGGIAQLLQWGVINKHDILMDSGDIVNYMIRGATRQPDLTFPNSTWGYGIMNLEQVFTYLASVT